MSSRHPSETDDFERSTSSGESGPRRSFGRDVVLPLVVLSLLGWTLWITRPVNFWEGGAAAGPADTPTRSCLSNLNRIAAAFAQYAQDYDGKFPRGVDPEDRHFPEGWRLYYRGRYERAARTAPMLHDLLHPYTRERRVWCCPADNGWKTVDLPHMESHLRNVRPSSYARFGTSYYYLTRHGFGEMRASDLLYPSQSLLLFDGTMWHQAPSGQSARAVNVLFGDGHTGTLTREQFERAVSIAY